MKSIVVFGDSLVFGSGDEKGLCGWVGRVKSSIEYLKKPWHVFNLGIPAGEKSIDILKRFRTETEVRYKTTDEGNKIVLIFAIGINDTKLVGNESVTELGQFKKNIKQLLNQAKRYSGKRIIVVGILPVDESKVEKLFGWISFKNQTIEIYNQSLKQICNQLGVLFCQPLISLKEIARYQKSLNYDGIHPSSHGYEIIVPKLLSSLKKWV